MNTLKKVTHMSFQTLGSLWNEMRIQGKVYGLYFCFKEKSLIQPSRSTLKGLLKLKNRQEYKMHKLFH